MYKYSENAKQNEDTNIQSVAQSCMEQSEYNKNDTILISDSNADIIGIVEKGSVYLKCLDGSGNTSILDFYNKGDIFGTLFFPDDPVNLYYFSAKTSCKINKIDFRVSELNTETEKYINKKVREEIKRKQIHIEILSQRTIRNKLLTLFGYFSDDSGRVRLPMSLSDISEYISVNRSAMMREIKNMHNDKLIYNNKKEIHLINKQTML